MIIRGHLLLPESEHARLVPGWLRVEAGRIVELAAERCPHTADLGDEGTIVMPGFIDTHLHLPQFDAIGRDGLELLDWLEQVIFPAEACWAEADLAGEMTTRATQQLLRHGTTGFAGYATVHADATRAALEVVRSSGMRAVIGQVLMDQQAPVELMRPAVELIRESATLLDDYGTGDRVAVSVNPRFAITCSGELLRAAGELASRTGAMVQTHFAETLAESQQVRQLHGSEYLDVYKKSGLLRPRSLLAHGIHLSESDLRTLKTHQTIIAHCPTANAFLQSGTMNRARYADAGIPLSLGSDIAGGPQRSMVRVAQAMIDAAKLTGSPIPSAAACFAQITSHNADRLGWSDTGRLVESATADLLIIEPDVAWQTLPDPLSTLLWSWDDRWLKQVMVMGQICY